MKKINYFFAVAAVFLASCSNNDEPILSENQQPETARVTYIRADANEDATTRGSVDGTTAAFTWNTGDKIAVWADGYKISDDLASEYNATNAATFAFSGDNAVTESNRANFAIFPASLVWDGTSIRSGSASDYTATSLKLTLPASYTLAQVQDDVSPTPMIATNAENGDLAFKALCPLLRVTVVNIPKQTKRIEFDFNGNKVQGEFTLTGVAPGTTAIATSITDGADDIITVTMEDNSIWHDNLVINLPVPTGTYGNITITAYDATSDGHAVLTLTKPIKSTGWTPTRKSSRKMTATLPVFSVSAGKKVVFAPGNLQYNDSETTYKWRFAANQYDYVGAWDTTTWVDLLGWGTWTGSSPNPLNTSTTASDYSWNSSDFTQESLLADATQRSYNWRTLTFSEWNYIIKSRTTTTTNMPTGTNSGNAKYTKATVAGVEGVILFPDNYAHPAGTTVSVSSAAYNNAGDNAFTTFTVDAANWTYMEAAGAVFLPAAGYRNGTTVLLTQTDGVYWSQTNFISTDADDFQFSANYLRVNYQPKNGGESVRLVREVE